MKRVVLVVFIGVALCTMFSRRQHHVWAGERSVARGYERNRMATLPPPRVIDPVTGLPAGEQQIVVAYRDDQPAKPAQKRPGGPRDRSKPAPAPKLQPETTKTDPKVTPEWFPQNSEEETALAHVNSQGYRVFVSGLSGSEAKARIDLRQKIEREVTQWLAGDVATGWKPSAATVDRLINATFTKPVIKDAGVISKNLDELVTLYLAGAKVDFSQKARNEVVQTYKREIVRDRMIKGGSVLGFVLIALAVFSGYIRADEATKGHYTNRLRILSAASMGAAGVVLYQMLT